MKDIQAFIQPSDVFVCLEVMKIEYEFPLLVSDVFKKALTETETLPRPGYRDQKTRTRLRQTRHVNT